MSVRPALTSFVLLSCLLPLVVRANHYEDKDGFHSIIKGNRRTENDEPVDLLLFHDNVKVNGKLFPFPMVQDHDYCYPPKGSKHAQFTITAFDVTDQGKGGLVFLKDDTGVGKDHVCFHIRSHRGRGYQFVINVYGDYK